MIDNVTLYFDEFTFHLYDGKIYVSIGEGYEKFERFIEEYLENDLFLKDYETQEELKRDIELSLPTIRTFLNEPERLD